VNTRDDWDRHWSDLYVSTRYSPAQAFRRELLIHWLERHVPEATNRLLDIGSGQGDLIASLSQVFPKMELAGVEASGVGIAQSQIKAPRAEFFQRDLQLLPDPKDPLTSWAHLAVCSEVLEHVDDPRLVLANASHYLAPGARLFITVPGGPISAFDRHIGHRQHFTKASLQRLIQESGLIPEQVCGVGFPFFNVYRIVVILRGKALIKDASGENKQRIRSVAKIVMVAFSFVLKRKFNVNKWGWQLIALARKPE